MRIAIAQIRLDGGTQTRAEIDLAHANEIADAIRNEVVLPPVVVFYDGADHWLADGFHRVTGARSAGLVEIDADVRQGTRRDAVLFSVGANATHGLKRTNADKRRAVETLLRDEEWSKWSDREIAKRAGVGYSLVADVRKAICPNRADATPRTVERNGVTYQQNTANIGRRDLKPENAPEPSSERPRATAPAHRVEHDSNPFEDDDGEDEPAIIAPEPTPIRVEQPRVGFGQSDVADRLARVNAAVRRFDVELRAAFANIDPRFDAEVRERSQDFLLNAAETLREFLSDAPARPALSVIRGGRS